MKSGFLVKESCLRSQSICWEGIHTSEHCTNTEYHSVLCAPRSHSSACSSACSHSLWVHPVASDQPLSQPMNLLPISQPMICLSMHHAHQMIITPVISILQVETSGDYLLCAQPIPLWQDLRAPTLLFSHPQTLPGFSSTHTPDPFSQPPNKTTTPTNSDQQSLFDVCLRLGHRV